MGLEYRPLQKPHVPTSSRGLGHDPLTVRTGVRIPVGTPVDKSPFGDFFICFSPLHLFLLEQIGIICSRRLAVLNLLRFDHQQGAGNFVPQVIALNLHHRFNIVQIKTDPEGSVHPDANS